MTNLYKESGVDITLGDRASSIAAKAAKATFVGRADKFGQAAELSGGFAGLIDCGSHYLSQCCDTVGTKIELCAVVNDYSGLGYDLLAMVADDAACLGAEVFSITNTFETKQIDLEAIKAMMDSLKNACLEQSVMISGGEIADVGSAHNGTSWGADAIGVVNKDKVITGQEVVTGDIVIALQEHGFRCNGFSLVRKLLQQEYGEVYAGVELAKQAALPSIIYHDAILKLHGRFGETPKVKLKGIAHITGGGIAANLKRILPANLGAKLDNLFHPPPAMRELQLLGEIDLKEFYTVWNGGNGMLLVLDKNEANTALNLLAETNIKAQVCGEITAGGKVELKAFNGKTIVF